MATWIVHLRLADVLLGTITALEAQAFAVGSVAPDSGVPDTKGEKFDPPPEVTHFRPPVVEQYRSADLEFYRRYLLPLRGVDQDARRVSFLLGYFLHLVTDNLWRSQVYLPAQSRFAAQFAADPRFIWEVKRDWYGLDLEYVRAHPRDRLWQTFLDSDCCEDYLDFLPGTAIAQSLAYIKQFYQRTDAEMERTYGERPGLYLSAGEMDAFIATAGARLLGIYRSLWERGIAPGEFTSALDQSFA